MELRPYQAEAIEAIQGQWESGIRRTLLVLPTGCGKTIVFCKLTERLVAKSDRVLIMAHRGELLDQAADKLYKSTGLRCAMEKASDTCLGSWFRVVVGSVQTLMREKRLEHQSRLEGSGQEEKDRHAESSNRRRMSAEACPHCQGIPIRRG